jgi:hypothetical protein
MSGAGVLACVASVCVVSHMAVQPRSLQRDAACCAPLSILNEEVQIMLRRSASYRRMRSVAAFVFVLASMACLLPAAAGAATLHATTSSFASTVASAQPGDTVLLASGSYGAWKGVTKTSPGVTIAPESGASPSMSLAWDTTGSPAWLTLDGLTITGGSISGPSHDITI